MAATTSAKQSGGRVAAFLTDVEGMWDRLASFARDNPYVSLDAQDRIAVRPGAVFVFGGDAVDRGPASRRVVAALLEARRRQPEQVVLLAGNRDINKLRLVRELAGHPPARTPDEVRRGPQADLLRWILANTMGAREAFEFRRAELGGGAVSDADVVESFLADVAPGGGLREYLAHCQLAHVEGGTLFVHGGVREEGLGVVPGVGRFADARAWVVQLNAWYRDQMSAFVAGALERSGRPAWDPLIEYQAPVPGTKLNPRSVVYCRLGDALNNPHLPAPGVVDALARAGIVRMAVGHTPSGDVPCVLRQPGFELVIADNSRARLPDASRVFLRDEGVEIAGRARLDDGRELEARVSLESARAGEPVGQRLRASGHLVNARLPGGEYLLFRYLEDYRVEQVAAPRAALCDEALVAPRGTDDDDA